jgi:hypothetical protein
MQFHAAPIGLERQAMTSENPRLNLDGQFEALAGKMSHEALMPGVE